MLEDESLLTRLQTHDEQALEYLIEQYGSFVLATIRAVGRGVLNSADVEEIAAQTFLNLWNAAAKIDLEKGTIKSYLGAVARNTARSRVRSLRPVFPVAEDYLSAEDQQLYHELERRERCDLVRQALTFLEPATKEIFLRYYYQRQKIAQIAEELEMNQSKVKSRLARGRDVLRRVLKERGISHEDMV